MPGPGYVKDRGLRGIQHTDKSIRLGGASWIEPLGSVVFFDDFNGKALNATDTWTSTATVGGTAAFDGDAGDPVAGHGGWLALTVTADADAIEVAMTNETVKGGFRASRAGNGLMIFQTRASIQQLTTRWDNCGFTDDETEGAAIAMSLSTATWTTAASDAALWGFYSTATDNDNWIGQTVDTNTDGTEVASAVAAAANTATVLRVEVDSAGGCYFYQSDGAVVDPVFQGSETAVGLTETVPLIPYLALAGTAAATVTAEYDYVFAACAR